MKKIFFSMALMLMTAGSFAQDILGTWLTEAGDAQVEIYKSGNTVNGKIVWLAKGPETKDSHNTDEKLRSRKLMGVNILSGLTKKKDRWEGGKIYNPKNGSYAAPSSQDDYWTLMFHADSLFDDGLYVEAKRMYDLAFTDDRYILPYHLSEVTRKMMGIRNDDAALTYLSHRVRMEPDFYEEPSTCPFPALRDTFEVRQRKWNYDLSQKNIIEWIFERDQYDRMLWSQAANRRHESPERIERLARRAMDTDSTNLEMVTRILAETGYPRKSRVGDFASQAVWLVIQHSGLDVQKQYLPQLEEAAHNGDLPLAMIAALKDRIDVREGRPQKYGTQLGSDGLCPLLDASRVNEWRKEVGLPPIKTE